MLSGICVSANCAWTDPMEAYKVIWNASCGGCCEYGWMRWNNNRAQVEFPRFRTTTITLVGITAKGPDSNICTGHAVCTVTGSDDQSNGQKSWYPEPKSQALEALNRPQCSQLPPCLCHGLLLILQELGTEFHAHAHFEQLIPPCTVRLGYSTC